MNTHKGWIAVDLDGTLAEYHGWVAPDNIGAPICVMVDRVRLWLDEGRDVRIFTARGSIDAADQALAYPAIRRWCRMHLGRELPITNVKDIYMIALYDDRAKQVVANTGELVEDQLTDALNDLNIFKQQTKNQKES